MRYPRKVGVSLTLLLMGIVSTALAHPLPRKIKVADDVFLFITPDYGDVGLDGNSIVVLSPDGVLVFDSNGTPDAAKAVLAEIRKMTDQPVRYLILSHWHWDHWYGAEVYQQAFPDIRIIAHEKERAIMMGPAIAFNEPGLRKDLPDYLNSLEKKIAAGEAADPKPAGLEQLKRLLEEDRSFLAQKSGVHHTFANLTFTDQLNLYLGSLHVQVLHYDRAVTPGDAFLYLPKERILITGDILVNPVSFALGCYPTGWLKTLERMDALDVAIIVPGHGEPLYDKELMHATAGVFRELLRLGKEAKEKGMDADQARAALQPGFHDLMVKITHDDPALNRQFQIYIVDWFLHRVYDELSSPLTDDIAPPPRS